MNTADLKAYAPKARRDFIAAVTKQAQKYGVTESTIHPVEINGDVCVVNGKPFPANMAPRIKRLAECVERLGFNQTMEQVAYSWFNRLIAIRYMELHDYLGHGRRVLSHPEHPTGFQILEECTDLTYGNDGDTGQLPHLTHEKVVELKLDGAKDEELYRELLLAQCHALHTAMPFLFEPVDDETELLLPENLTKTDSLIHDLITDISEDDWNNIEVIGWLYQFYISEKKDEVIGKVVKSEDIPAATQLFTPNWIVKYMVQNSLGAQWLATYPESPLKSEMEYYIEPAEQTDEVNAKLREITLDELNPEELTLIDPASGSGHILVEAYDLFKGIYLERGYRSRDIAQLILEKNLFGLDIDQRAAQMCGFALMMKAREDDRRLFERGVKLNVMAMVNSTNLDVDTLVHGIELSQYGLNEEDLTALKELFEHATTFGSLIQVPKNLAKKLPALKQLSELNSQDMFVCEMLEHLKPLIQQASILAIHYDAVVANPPFIGAKYLNPLLKKYAKDFYPASKTDLFAISMECFLLLLKPSGYAGFMTPFTWMFLSSFEDLRSILLEEKAIQSLIQPQYHTFFESAAVPICTFIIKNCSLSSYEASFIKLSEFRGAELQPLKTREAIKNTKLDWFYIANPDEFKKIPGCPIAYWVPKTTVEAFGRSSRISSAADAKQGLITGDNDKFLRHWHEVPVENSLIDCKSRKEAKESTKRWFPFQKGGSFRKWFGNHNLFVDWKDDGYAIQHFFDENGKLRSRPQSMGYYFKPGITWTSVTISTFNCRLSPPGFIYSEPGPVLYTEDVKLLPILAAFLNSKTANYLLQLVAPAMHYNQGHLANLPLPELGGANRDSISSVVDTLELNAKLDWDAYENSWGFQQSPMLAESRDKILRVKDTYNSWILHIRDVISETKLFEEENNRLFIDAYGLQAELTPETPIEQITLTVNPAYRYGVKGTEEERNTRFREDTMAELVSYAIGCMMGRYSLDETGLIYANSGNEGFDDLVERGAYTKFPADDDGIIPLTDKEWFADDAANRLVEFITVAWDAAHLEENLDFLAANLSPKKGEDSRDTIRRYLCDKFYKDHMQTYKKRPIYWLFCSGKTKAFQCLVYLHRYNESTLARMRTEYVIPLTAKLSSHIDKLENDKGASGSAAEIKKLEKEIKNLHKQQTELTEFDEKLKHYADMRIPLDLDDGVKVNYGKFGDLLAEVKAIHGKKV